MGFIAHIVCIFRYIYILAIQFIKAASTWNIWGIGSVVCIDVFN